MGKFVSILLSSCDVWYALTYNELQLDIETVILRHRNDPADG
jgi:hypothetical protein